MSRRMPQLMSNPMPPGEITPPVLHVHGCDATNGKPIAAVAVGHAECVAADAGQCGDVADLLVNSLVHFAHQFFCRNQSVPARAYHLCECMGNSQTVSETFCRSSMMAMSVRCKINRFQPPRVRFER